MAGGTGSEKINSPAHEISKTFLHLSDYEWQSYPDDNPAPAAGNGEQLWKNHIQGEVPEEQEILASQAAQPFLA
jgi:hypothetical protein